MFSAKLSADKKKITIECDVNEEPNLSSTGATYIVAGASGTTGMKIPFEGKDRELKIGLNVYFKNPSPPVKS